jgi:hypothetical protein
LPLAINFFRLRKFGMAFSDRTPKKILSTQSCVAALSGKNVFTRHFINGFMDHRKKSTHPVNVKSENNKTIIGIDFIHVHKLFYDVHSRQVKFTSISNDYIMAIQQTILPTMTSSIVNVNFKGKTNSEAPYMANICAPRTPMILGMSSIILVDKTVLLMISPWKGATF